MNCVFKLSLGVSTQIMEFEYKQAYRTVETAVLVGKSKNMQSYQPFSHSGSNMLRTRR